MGGNNQDFETPPEKTDYKNLSSSTENQLFTTIQTLQNENMLSAITEVDDENKITGNRGMPFRDEPEKPEKPELDLQKSVSPKPSHKRMFSMQQVTYEKPMDCKNNI